MRTTESSVFSFFLFFKERPGGGWTFEKGADEQFEDIADSISNSGTKRFSSMRPTKARTKSRVDWQKNGSYLSSARSCFPSPVVARCSLRA